jgi:MFS transporter, PHS family, inorganic phosphate transporter
MQIYSLFMFLGIFTTLLIPETRRISLEVLSGEESAETPHSEESVKTPYSEEDAVAVLENTAHRNDDEKVNGT